MAEPMKNRYHYESLQRVALDIQSVYPIFQVEAFLAALFDDTWGALELKERIKRISIQLGHFLPSEYPQAIHILDQIMMKYGDWHNGFASFIPMFVELYGCKEEYWDISIQALERYTQFASAEFAVRAFIRKDETRMMKQMLAWSKSDHAQVRRLACEGCRATLPWGQTLPALKKDPTPILPILEQLKQDSSMDVRKSVANHLNGISKTHPELVVRIAKAWYGKTKECDWVVKHGCRTLIKNGNSEILELLGKEKG